MIYFIQWRNFLQNHKEVEDSSLSMILKRNIERKVDYNWGFLKNYSKEILLFKIYVEILKKIKHGVWRKSYK